MSAFAQDSYEQEQQQVLSAAANQWIVHQLREVNPPYFDCSKAVITHPVAGEFPLFGQSVVISEEEVERYNRWWFPDGDCQRFL